MREWISARLPWVIGGVSLLVLAALWGLRAQESVKFRFGLPPEAAGRTRVIYWEKWTGFERDGMQTVIDAFNQSQDRIWVEYVSVSSINQKTLVATAGGRPPDVAGLWDGDVVVFADKQALIPLDELCRAARLGPEHYIPVYWDMCTYDGKIWALPSTPATTALHYNTRMFKAAGLDPQRPPKTFAELDAMSERLTLTDDQTGRILQMGFLPPEPGWWHHGWGTFWGGSLWDGGANITFDTPPYVAAFTWIQKYAKQYGVSALQTFRSSFGNFSSPQNPFMSGQVAMVLQGVWMSNYIFQNNPKLEWAAAPFPVVRAGDPPVTFAGSDMLMIPRGAKHPQEAFEFIAFVQRQPMMEKLCLSHRKNSPLRKVSESFYRQHENPYIRMFQQLAWSKNAMHAPKMSVWNEYGGEISNAFERVWLLQAEPQQALADAAARVRKVWAHQREVHDAAPSKKLAVAPFVIAALIVLAVIGTALVRELGIRREVGGDPPRILFRKLRTGLAFASPWLVGLSLFTLYPIAASIIYAFSDFSVLQPPKWVGLYNFSTIASDEVFRISLWNTLRYAVVALPLGMLLSIGVALLLDSNVRGSDYYRTFVFLPSVTPLVASAMVWLWIFNGEYGVLNDVIRRLSFGMVGNIPWLSDATWAMPALILMSFWGIGHTVVILLASLQDVPVSLYEAADLDGANWWHKVRHITLPMVSPVIYFNTIMGIIGSLQVFAVPYIMTSGGPARSTLFYSMYLYDNAFRFLKMGYASAMAWILFLIILVLTGAAVRFARTRVYSVGS